MVARSHTCMVTDELRQRCVVVAGTAQEGPLLFVYGSVFQLVLIVEPEGTAALRDELGRGFLELVALD